MEIVNIAAGVTSFTNKEIETAVQCLSFEMTGPHGGATTPQTILAAIVGNAEMNLVKQDGVDTQSLIQSLKIVDLAQIATDNNGVIKIATNGANCTVNFTLEVSNDGSLILNDGAKLLFAVSGIPATTSTIIDGIDNMNYSDTYIRYEAKFVNALASKDFNIAPAYAMALPVGQIKVLELTYYNGKTVKFSERELKQEAFDHQDPIVSYDGKTTWGYDAYIVLNVENVKVARVMLTASTNFYLMRKQTV